MSLAGFAAPRFRLKVVLLALCLAATLGLPQLAHAQDVVQLAQRLFVAGD
jgi:hypothetical protein